MRYFCTLFDRNYLARALALYESLTKHCPSFRLSALCLDHEAYALLAQMALPSFRLIRIEDFEQGDSELLKAKRNRSRIEYYFTCTPSLPLYVLDRQPEVDLVTYLDADLFFYGDPAPLFREIGNRSVAIIAHRFHPRLAHREVFGTYNVGWFSIRRDRNGLACLRWWREQCLEWCYDRLEAGKFADQKYMDDFPSRFEGVAVLQHKGANVAPWNVGNYQVRWDGKQLWIDEDPLIFFHFHGLKRLAGRVYDSGLGPYKVRLDRFLAKRLFLPYLIQLLRTNALVSEPSGAVASVENMRSPTGTHQIQRWYRRFRRLGRIIYQVILPRNYLFAPDLQESCVNEDSPLTHLNERELAPKSQSGGVT